MKAMIEFMRDVRRTPIGVQVWLGVLMATNGVAPLFFLGTIEGVVVFALQMMSAMAMVALHARFGFTRLLGAGHVLWVPMVVFLLVRLAATPGPDGALRVWMIVSVALSSISLLIDTADVIRYLRGARERIV